MKTTTHTTFLCVFLCALSIACGQKVVFTWYDYEVSNLVWSGQNVVLLLTTSGQLYRSIDEGKTWVDQYSRLPNSGTYTVVQIHQDIQDDKKILLVANGGRVGWITTDAGANYTAIAFGFAVDEATFDLHPQVSGWFLVGELNTANYYITRDFGKSLTKVASDWAIAKWEAIDTKSEGTIFAKNVAGNFGYTNDFGKSFALLYRHSIDFLFTHSHLFVVVSGADFSTATLTVSSGAHTSIATYQAAQFPFGDTLPQQGYVFLDDSSGAEWMGVVHTKHWGTLYTSGALGVKYTTSLQHLHFDYPVFDFAKVNGLEGIYIGNTVLNWEQDTDTVQLATQITFDNGGEWHYLTPPKVDAYGREIIVCEKCHLHLNGLSAWGGSSYGPFYSAPNAIGIIIATGNIGEYLSHTPEHQNTYFSRDAGLTWFELLEGQYIYDIGDHGGILVFADNSKLTKQIFYSVDEGLTLTPVDLAEETRVVDIVTDGGGTTRKFLLQGVDNIVGIDFTDVLSRQCGDADYEPWTPTDGRKNGQACQLGRNVTYLRRIREANCYNSREMDHVVSTVNCNCAEEDYECDFGYEETIVDGKFYCRLSGNPPVEPPVYCPAGSKYDHSHGYRKVAGDSCVVPLPQYAPETRECPATNGPTQPSSNKAVIAVAIIFSVIAVVGIAAFFVNRNEVWRAKFLSAIGKVIPIGGGGGGGAYSRLGRQGLANDEEFAIGGDHLDDSDVEEDAPVLQDKDILQATSSDKDKKGDDFDPRT